MIMLSRFKFLALLMFAADLALLGVMVHYTSWLFVLGFIIISGISGVWLLNDPLRHYLRKSGRAMNGNEISIEDFLLGAASRLAAGVLLIVPGVLTDLMALFLLSPAGKGLVQIFISSLYSAKFSRFSKQGFESRTSGEKSIKDEIIDVKVMNAGGEKPGETGEK